MLKRFSPWGYTATLAAGLLAINVLAAPLDRAHPDEIVMVVYLAVAGVLMTLPQVRIEQGRLTLNGIAAGAAAVVLNPLDATAVSLAIILGASNKREPWRLITNPILFALGACMGSITAGLLSGDNRPSLGVRLVVQVVMSVANPIFASTAIGIREGMSPLLVLKRNVTRAFLVAFVYLALAAVLMSYVLDGSPLGYVLATIVCALSLALTDSIAGRRIRSVLETELSDADRHLFHSRAVEGVVHNLRNHVATVHAYLKEIDPRKLDEIDRDSLATASAAAEDAVTVLHSLAQGATPKVSYAPKPVDLSELASQAAGLARARARAKEIQLSVRESAADVKVRADPLLIREVMTNLVNNAIDAAPVGGRVAITSGSHNGSPFVSVSDNGPGVAEENRHHLFEPHFTTKEGGTGLGLFMSYGVVREHQGELVYEGSARGGVFTVTLPPYSRS